MTEPTQKDDIEQRGLSLINKDRAWIINHWGWLGPVVGLVIGLILGHLI